MSTNCQVCGTNFSGRRGAKTCSDRCRTRLHRLTKQFNYSHVKADNSPGESSQSGFLKVAAVTPSPLEAGKSNPTTNSQIASHPITAVIEEARATQPPPVVQSRSEVGSPEQTNPPIPDETQVVSSKPPSPISDQALRSTNPDSANVSGSDVQSAPAIPPANVAPLDATEIPVPASALVSENQTAFAAEQVPSTSEEPANPVADPLATPASYHGQDPPVSQPVESTPPHEALPNPIVASPQLTEIPPAQLIAPETPVSPSETRPNPSHAIHSTAIGSANPENTSASPVLPIPPTEFEETKPTPAPEPEIQPNTYWPPPAPIEADRPEAVAVVPAAGWSLTGPEANNNPQPADTPQIYAPYSLDTQTPNTSPAEPNIFSPDQSAGQPPIIPPEETLSEESDHPTPRRWALAPLLLILLVTGALGWLIHGLAVGLDQLASLEQQRQEASEQQMHIDQLTVNHISGQLADFVDLNVSGLATINNLEVTGSSNLGDVTVNDFSSDSVTTSGEGEFGSLLVHGDSLLEGDLTVQDNTSLQALSATTIAGDGAGITNLNASSISHGTLADARLTPNVALLDRNNQVFSGNNTFQSNLSVGQTLFTNTLTPTGDLAIGSSDQALTLQGNSSTILTATSGGFTSTLAFIPPVADAIYRIPAHPAGVYDFCTNFGNCIGGGGSAPAGADYVTLSLNPSLTNERVLTAGANLLLSDGGANGNITIATVSDPTFSTSVTTPLVQSSGTLTLTSSGVGNDIVLNSADTIELQGATNITGALDVSTTLAIGTGNAFQVDTSGNVVSGTINGQTITSAATFTGTLAVATLGSAGSTSLCRNGSNQLSTCSGSGGSDPSVTLQNAYNNGNTITTTDGRNIAITLSDTATDQTVTITQNGTANALRINPLTTADNLAQVAISTGATTNKGLVVQGIALQTANLQEWQNSTGAILASLSNAGKLTVGVGVDYPGSATSGGIKFPTLAADGRYYSIGSGGTNQQYLYFSGSNSNGVRTDWGGVNIELPQVSLGFNAANVDYTTALIVQATSSTRKALVVKAAASQTADLLQLQNSSGTVLSHFNSAGSLALGSASAPADVLDVTGSIRVSALGAAGSTSVCRNGSNQLATCSGSGGSDPSVTLQNAYANGNTISTTDGRNIQITLNNTATDQTVEITQAGTTDAFRVNDDGTFTDTTPFVIDAAGNVGIGTAAPGAKLNVNGTSWLGADVAANNPVRIEAGLIRMVDNTNSGRTLQVQATQLIAGELNSDAYNYSDGGQIASIGRSTNQLLFDASGNASTDSAFRITLDSTGNHPILNLHNKSTAASTFYANSATGNVGIGTASPTAKLEVYPTSANSTATALRIANIDVGTSAGTRIDFGLSLSGASAFRSAAQIDAVKTDTWTTGSASTADADLVFNTRLDDVMEQSLKITSAGDLVLSNTADLVNNITGPINRSMVLRTGDINGADDELGFDIDTDTTGGVTNYVRVLTVDSANGGSIGIGDTTPAYLLTVGNGDLFGVQSDASLIWEGTSADASETVLSVVNPTADITYRLADAAAGTYDLCSTAGNCLTGGGAATLQTAYNASTSPEITLDATRGALTVRDNATPIGANLLEVQNNAGSTSYLAVTSSATTLAGNLLPATDDTYDLGSAALRWRDLYLGPTSLHLQSTAAETTTARDWAFAIQETDGVSEGNLRVIVGGSDVINVTPTGNVGIGTTAPGTSLHVRSDTGIRSQGAGRSDGVDITHTSVGNYKIDSTGTGSLTVMSSGGPLQLQGGTSSDDLIFRTGDTTGTRVTIKGGAGSDLGFVGIGTTSPAVKLDVSANPGSSAILRLGGDVSSSATDDVLGVIQFASNDTSFTTTNPKVVAKIEALTTEGYGADTDSGAKLAFYTTPNDAGASPTPSVRMTIDQNGNVGIGTTNPGVALQIGAGLTSTLPDGVGTGFTPQVINSQTSGIAGISTYLNDGTNNRRLGIFVDNINGLQGISSTSSTSVIPFVYRDGNAERLRIDNTGRVGIGDTSPAYLLTVGSGDLFGVNSSGNVIVTALGAAGSTSVCRNGSNQLATCSGSGGSDPSVTLQNAYANGNTISTTDGRDIEITLTDQTTDTTFEITQAGTATAFRVNDDGTFSDSTPFVVDASGKLGVGTTSPLGKIHVVGSGSSGITIPNADEGLILTSSSGTSGKNRLYFENTGSTSGQRVFFVDNGTTDGILSFNSTNDAGTAFNTANILTLKASGGVGVGVITPQAPLHVRVGTDQNFTISTSASQVRLSALNDAGTANTALRFQANDYHFINNLGAAEILTILNSGNVGIGTTSPGALLHTALSSGTNGLFERASADANGVALQVRKSRGSLGSPAVVSSGDSIGGLSFTGYDANSYETAARIVAAVDATPGDGDMPGRLQFYTTPDGSATEAERMRINNAGNVGINTTGPDRKLDVLDASNPQLRLTHTDGSVYTEFQADSGGDLTVNPSGGQVYFADGDTLNIGGVTALGYNAISDSGGVTSHGLASDDDLFIEGDLEVNGTLYADSGITSGGNLTVTGHILPGADDTYDLGSAAARWRDLYLGPTSLHIQSTAAETTTARDWAFGIQETDGASEGNLRVTMGGSDLVNITPGGNVGIGTTAPQAKLDLQGGDILQSQTDHDFVQTYGGFGGGLTNLISNPSVENASTSGWAQRGTNTIASVTDQALHGLYSLKATYQDDNRLALPPTLVLAATTTYSMYFYVYVPADWDGGQITIGDDGGFAGSTQTKYNADMSLRDQWQRVTMILTTASDNTGTIHIRTTSAPTVGKFVYFDNVQVNTGSTPLAFSPLSTAVPKGLTTIGELTVTGIGNSYFAGNIGIGTTSITGTGTRLQVQGAGGTGLNGMRLTHGTEGSNWDLTIGGSGNSFPGGFAIADEGTARLVIDSTGNVGVGTTTPTYKLDVAGNVQVLNGLAGFVNSDTTNLVPNSGFESGNTTNWSLSGGPTAVAETGGGGRYALEMVSDATGTHFLESDFMPATAAADYIGNYWLKAQDGSLGGNWRVRILWFDASQVSLGESATITATTGVSGWQKVTVTGTAPANTAYAKLRFTEGIAETIRLDNVQFHAGTTAAVYADTLQGGSPTVATGLITNSAHTASLNVTGNVGIGTAAPKVRLQITGSTAVNSPTLGSASGGFYLTNTDVNYGLLAGVAGDGDPWLQAQRTDGTATAYNLNLQPSGGNVGIGTIDPSAKLHVVGGTDSALASGGYLVTGSTTSTNITMDDNEILARNNGAASTLHLNSDGGTVAVSANTNGIFNVNNNALYVTAGNNVGIGTTAPGGLGGGGTRTDLQVHNAGTTTASFGNLVLSSAATGDTSLMGCMQFGSTGLSGADKRTANICSNKEDALTVNPVGSLRFSTANGGSPTERMRIDENGNVGIGTTGPDSRLHVVGGGVCIESSDTGCASASGNLRVSGGSKLGNVSATPAYADHTTILSDSGTAFEGGLLLTNSDSGTLGTSAIKLSSAFGGGTGADFQLGVVDQSTPNTFATTFLYGDGATGNVGIGNTGPGFKLDVTGDVRLNNAGTLRFYRSDGTTQGLTVSAGATNNFITGTNGSIILTAPGIFNDLGAGSSFNVRNAGAATTHLTVLESSGNVGIGDSTPTEGRLVVGTNTTANETIAVQSGANSALLLTADTDNDGGEVGTSYISFSQDNAGVTSILGTIQTAGQDSSGASFTNALANATLLGAKAGNFALQFGTGSAVNMTILNGGLVGIGTNSPSEELEVNGEIEIAGGETVDDKRLIFAASDKTDRFFIETDLDASTPNDLLGFRGLNTDNILVLRGDGNVGIGTITPAARLEVASGTAPSLTGTGWSQILNDTRTAAAGVGGSLLFKGYKTAQSAQAVFAGIWGQKENATAGDESGALLFYTNPNTGTLAERMRVTSAGNVGIGTTGPAGKLEVSESTDANVLQFLTATSTTKYAASTVRNTASGGASLETYAFGPTYTGVSYFGRAATDTTNIVSAGDTSLGIGTFGATPLLFGTNNAERMRIDSTGNVGIGTTDPSAQKLVVAGNVRVGIGTDGCVEDADGTVIAGTCSSDERLKTNIQGFEPILDRFGQLRAVTYNWRAEEFPDRHLGTATQQGLIAQEVEALFPELVSMDSLGFKQINFSALPIYNIQATAELKLRVDELDQRLSQLEPVEDAQPGDEAQAETEGPAQAETDAEAIQNNSDFSDLNVANTITANELKVVQLVTSAKLEVTGLATIAELKVTGLTSVGDIVISGHVIGNADTRGTLTIPAGATSASYSFSRAYGGVPHVVVSAQANPGSFYWVEKTATGFVIHLAEPTTADLTFDYMVQQ